MGETVNTFIEDGVRWPPGEELPPGAAPPPATPTTQPTGPSPDSPPEGQGQGQGGDPRFFAVLDAMRALHIKKAADYGLGADPLANLRASEEFGVPAWMATMVRLNDKVTRIKAFCQKGKLENESLEDSFMDLAAYAVLVLLLYREAKTKESPSGN